MLICNTSKNNELINKIFNKNEIEIINNKLKNLNIERIIYCSFENRFAKSGGLGAVTQAILPYLDSYQIKTNAILISPFYTNIIKNKNIKKSNLKFNVPFNNKNIEAEILEYQLEYNIPKKGVLKEYFIKAKGFFNSKNNLNDPYVYKQNNIKANNEKLILNALFFCKAVPFFLRKIKTTENIVFHLQDWQTGLITLISKEALLNNILKSCSSTLTMHNCFDSYIGERYLKMITGRGSVLKEFTALQIAIELSDTPATTVSKSFSREFTRDIIQKEHYAPHLQSIFNQNKIKGISNGMFIDFPDEYKEHKISINEIKKSKHEARVKLLKIIKNYPNAEYFGELTYQGKSIMNLPEDIPIFVMTGRLDFLQKGYDIFLHALKRFDKDSIKVILTPKAVRDSDLIFFKNTAEECYGNIIIFYKNMTYGFSDLQSGSTFGVMPSIYEPFGAAIEYMVRGTVVIARKTGGLKDQIDKNCGILFREKNKNYTLENIKNFSELNNKIEEKIDNNNWVKDMTEALYNALNQAKCFYQQENDRYYKMIKNGFKKAKRFTWQKSVKEYFKIYRRYK